VEFDQYLWNWNPRTRGDGRPEGQTNHRGNFFRTPFTDERIGGQWVRRLSSPDFQGSLAYLRDYCTDTFGGSGWQVNNGDPHGYGFEFLNSEAADPAIPGRPRIQYAGAPSYPLDQLHFVCSDFADPQGNDTFGAISWRVAEIAAPGLAGYLPGQPRRYEIETLWASSNQPSAALQMRIPAAQLRAGRTYRVRARFEDNTGRQSHWSEPVEFVAGAPDVSAWRQALRISEVMYHPPSARPEEDSAGFDTEDFEFIELLNLGSRDLNLADLRFTGGIEQGFADSTLLAPGAVVLLVKNLEAFHQRYGTNPTVIGVFASGNLSNGGEVVRISIGYDAEIHAFTYDDRAPWPEFADGQGGSLERIRLADPDHANPEHWRATTLAGGTPGRVGTITYDAWAKGSANLVDPEADPDHDGKANWVEFALGSLPGTPDGPVVLEWSPPAAAANALGVRFVRSSVAEGVRMSVEASPDLITWVSAGEWLESRPGAGGTVWETHRVAVDPAGSAQIFLRLRLVREF
jgi:hypothetical protein